MSLAIRKVLTVVEETRSDGGRGDGEPLRKAATAVVFANPYAGGGLLGGPLRADRIERRARHPDRRALCGGAGGAGGKPRQGGDGGDGRRAGARKRGQNNDLRQPVPRMPSVGGRPGCHPRPSAARRARRSTCPICFKDEIWVRSHYDTVTLFVPDAPAPNEIVLIGAVASRGRLNARLGGVGKEQALVDRDVEDDGAAG